MTNEEFFTEAARRQMRDVYGTPHDSEGASVHGSQAHSYSYGQEELYYQNSEYAKRAAPKSQMILLERFKREIEDRGGRGLVAL